jgi:hypothetical protein
MSIELNNLGRLRVARESTFGVEVDFTAVDSASILSIPAVEGSISVTLGQQVLDPNALVVYLDQKIESELGVRSATLSFSVPAISPGATVNNTTHTRNALGFLLRDLLGGENLSQGHTITSVTDNNTYAVAGAIETTHFVYAGSAVGLPLTNSTEWRPIYSSTVSTVDTKFDTSGTLQTGLAYGCSTYYPTENPSNSLQFAVYGVESDDRWVLLGGQLESMAIEMSPGGIPQFNFTVKFANWLHGSSSSTLASSYEVANSITGTLSAPTYSNTNYIVNSGGWLYWSLNGTTTYSSTQHATSAFPVPCTSESYNIGVGYIPVTSPSGVQTIARWRRNRNKPIFSGQFSLPYEDVQWMVDKTTKLDRGMFRVIGGTAGATMILDAPTVQVTDVQRVNENGLAYQQVSWEARHDGVSTAGNGDAALTRAAFRLHFG